MITKAVPSSVTGDKLETANFSVLLHNYHQVQTLILQPDVY